VIEEFAKGLLRHFTPPNDTFASVIATPLKSGGSNLYSYRSFAMLVLKSFVAIINEDRSVMQNGRTGFQPVIPVGWASSPSIKWDGQSRVSARDYQEPVRQSRVLRGTSPPNRLLSRDYS
jgi:hypothetical protein